MLGRPVLYLLPTVRSLRKNQARIYSQWEKKPVVIAGRIMIKSPLTANNLFLPLDAAWNPPHGAFPPADNVMSIITVLLQRLHGTLALKRRNRFALRPGLSVQLC